MICRNSNAIRQGSEMVLCCKQCWSYAVWFLALVLLVLLVAILVLILGPNSGAPVGNSDYAAHELSGGAEWCELYWNCES